MAYEIEQVDGHFEMRLSGVTSKFEIMEMIGELTRRNPGMKRPGMWFIEPESQVPFSEFTALAGAIARVLPAVKVRSRTALVSSDEFQRAQMNMFLSEASMRSYEIQIHSSREEALAWLLEDR